MKDVYSSMPADERENRWLASKVALQRGGKRQMIPVWAAFPYLIVGFERWDVDENLRAQMRGIHIKYGKHGAAGTVFHMYV